MLSNKRKEKISAFLDNDMHRDELMSFSLSGEPDDAKLAQRYQMMGEALRGEMSDSSFVDVSLAVREVLAGEQSYALETVPTSSESENESKKIPSTSTNNGWFNLSNWYRPVAGMTVALSVAVVMVVTLSEQDPSNPSLAITSPVATNDSAQPVVNSAVQLAVEEKAGRLNTELQDTGLVNQHVDPRLVNQHLDFATQDALQGRLPLVRAVSYEAEK